MAVLPILCWPDPRLSQPCTVVDAFDPGIARLAGDMLETMYAAEGRGLAAPQVGDMRFLFVMDVAWKEAAPDPRIFVNPVILERGGEAVDLVEGCLSIPDCPVPLRRPGQVRLAWQDLEGRACEEVFEGFAAACVQHECDHLDGVLILDRASPEVLAGLAGPLDALRAAA
ncbi:peptide deformylase [Frigidibacter sp. ROC022]|uniref:peptide deformylase n=1 Tax=Frigidibacter sp. ROC022 TaxID=2971796 RepID=UPI00215A6E1B|nr:peptide deformylase [Frigidibacter sp. ROC022]MCR8724243.1 peptide deformylase [Frigidibacter sp. ROC022]